jgi:AcrR family transcriptional regulator
MRADARQNHDRLLDAAARAFARDGPEASLKAIAQDAGVGIGTLYRRFPTRQDLVEATYRNEIVRLCATAPELLETSPPLDALRAWMAHYAAFMATKYGMAGALRAILADDGDKMQTRALLTEALAAILAAGAADGTITDGLDPYDVLMSLGGVSIVAGEPDQGDRIGRLINLLITGLAHRA